MAALPNPFVDEPLGPQNPRPNPFLEAAVLDSAERDGTTALTKTTRRCSDPACRRSHRPDGSHYAKDNTERYHQLVADGKLGPQFGHLASLGKDKRTKRAVELVAEQAAEHAEKIAKVYRDGVDELQPMGIRLQAAKEWIGVETEMERMALKRHAQEFDQMSRGQLVEEIATMLEQLTGARTIVAEVEDERNYADAVVVEE